MKTQFLTLQCVASNCGFRFPVYGQYRTLTTCPRCGAKTRVVEKTIDSPIVTPGYNQAPQVHIEGFLDNIRSAFNVGSIFRTSDGVGLNHLHLCGMTATPEHPKVSKTALGSEFSVPWTHYPNTLSAIESIKKDGLRLWALEGGENAQSIYEAAQDIADSGTVLVIGNEVTGIDPAVISACERSVFIPMLGYKRSLNVAIAFGIAVYTLKFTYNILEKKA